MDFLHTFTVILPSVTRTLDNSNLPLTRSNFRFPSGHFLHNFTFDNSNHVCQYVTSQNKQCTLVQNIILKQLYELFVSLTLHSKRCQFSSGSAGFHKVLLINSFFKMSINLLAPLNSLFCN